MENKYFKYPRIYFIENARYDIQGDLHILYPDSALHDSFIGLKWYRTYYRDFHKTDPIKGLKKFCKINKLELIYVGEVK